MAMLSFLQAELGKSLRINSLEVLDISNSIRKTKASFFSFLLLRDLSMMLRIFCINCRPFSDCMPK